MYKLSPSDFAFLYEECKLCYYLKIKHDIQHPRMPFPGVFSTMNTKLQTPMVGKTLKTISKKLPEGVVERQEGFVQSKVIPGTNVYIKGKYDLLVKKSDGTYILVDLKISKPDVGKIEKYKTQLFSYKFALEHPSYGNQVKVSELGLLIFYPDSVELKKESAFFDFAPKWLEIPIDEKSFMKFMKEIDKLLSGSPPEEGETCKWCAYRHKGEEISHIKGSEQEEIPF